MTITHDIVFKTFLTDVQVVRDFLSIHLPEPLLKLCDLSTLHLESGSLLDSDQRPHYTDILYSVRVANEQGAQRGYIYQLVEHQSTPDPMMAFRLLEYGDTVEPDRLLKTLAMGSPEYKEVVMSVAQKLREHGKQLGLKEGLHLGEQKGRIGVIRELLASGADFEDLKQKLKITEEEIKQLKH